MIDSLSKVSSISGFFHEAPTRTPNSGVADGPLTGNGDLGCMVGANERTVRFYLSKNDFWYSVPQQSGGGVKSLACLELRMDLPRNLHFHAEQKIAHAEILITLSYQNDGNKAQELSIHSYIPHEHNMLVTEITCTKGNPLLTADLIPTPDPNADFSHKISGNYVLASKSYQKPDVLWETHACAACHVLNYPSTTFRLWEGETATIITCVATNHDTPLYESFVRNMLNLDFEELLPIYLERTCRMVGSFLDDLGNLSSISAGYRKILVWLTLHTCMLQ